MGTEFYIREVIQVNVWLYLILYKNQLHSLGKTVKLMYKMIRFVLEFGLACQLGVLVDIPSLGVAKKLFQVDGLEKNDDHKQKVEF